MSTKLVNNIVFGKNYCRLCFGDAYDDDLRFHDEVVINLKSEKISSILAYVLGGKCTGNMAVTDTFCNVCVQALKNSYNFMRMCKNNSDRLEKTVLTLNEALQSVECTGTSKSVLIQIDTTDYSFMQFHQYRRSAKLQNMAHNPKQYIKNRPPSAVGNLSKYVVHNQYTKSPNTDAVFDESNPNENIVKDVKSERKLPRIKTESKLKGTLEAQQNKLKEIIQNNLRKKKKNFARRALLAKKKSIKQRIQMLEKATEKLVKIKKEKYVCNECGMTYYNRPGIVSHLQDKHSLCGPYICQYCSDSFNSARKLRYHIRHYHVLGITAQCDLCKITFSQLESLYKHRRKHFDPKSKHYIEDITE